MLATNGKEQTTHVECGVPSTLLIYFCISKEKTEAHSQKGTLWWTESIQGELRLGAHKAAAVRGRSGELYTVSSRERLKGQ